MAGLRKTLVVAPELLSLTDMDLTVLDLALATVIDNWNVNQERALQHRGPLQTPAEVAAARLLHEHVLQIKKGQAD
jgi:hypothetical protein